MSAAATAPAGTDMLRQLDESGITRTHWKIMFISGMGFFTEFGPNSTTFVYPAELFPVETRTTGHGIAAAAGKLGGFVGVFLFPVFMSMGGLRLAEAVAALVSVIGLGVTVFFLPETKGKSLEELGAAAEAA